jgi:hypothetical protein
VPIACVSEPARPGRTASRTRRLLLSVHRLPIGTCRAPCVGAIGVRSGTHIHRHAVGIAVVAIEGERIDAIAARLQKRIGTRQQHLPCVIGGRAAQQFADHTIDLLLTRQRRQRLCGWPTGESYARHSARRHGQSEIDAVEDGARVHPGVTGLRIAVGRLMAKDRLSETAHQLCGARRGVGRRIHGAQRTRHQFKGRLHLGPVRG